MADYSTAQREQMAKDGTARSDGSYPIANRQDLADAILSIGRTPPDQRQAVKNWIVKRARALNLVSLLPKSWGITS